MNADIEITENDDEYYQPEPVTLIDSGVIIFDPIEFVEKYQCTAAQYFEGQLYVLDKTTSRWRNVEPEKPKLTSAKN